MQKKQGNPLCPYCKSGNILKKGFRKTRSGNIPKRQCGACHKSFSEKVHAAETYHHQVALNAVSLYNLGNPQSKVIEIINKRFKVRLPQSTLSSWINKFKLKLPYHRIREACSRLYKPSTIIFKKPLEHQQVYQFQYHKAKLDLLAKDSIKLALLKDYLKNIQSGKFPHHIFQPYHGNGASNVGRSRASQIKFDVLDIATISKDNFVCSLAGIALNLARNNYQRHQVVQDFALINDTVTVAVEVPVYLTGDDIKYFQSKKFLINFSNYRTPLTGHIDILQLRNNMIYILDYKPEAQKVKPIEQLTLYALALASRTKLALMDFKCAWFDENNYFEFFPLHAVYEKRGNHG